MTVVTFSRARISSPATREQADGRWAELGGGGVQAAVARGISKININSELRRAFRTTLEQVLRDNPDQVALVKIIGPVIDAVQRVVEEKIEAFGSTGKARTS